MIKLTLIGKDELDKDTIRNNMIYVKIGVGPLCTIDSDTTIQISLLSETKFYMEIEEEE